MDISLDTSCKFLNQIKHILKKKETLNWRNVFHDDVVLGEGKVEEDGIATAIEYLLTPGD